MDENIIEELDLMHENLVRSGFFDEDEILEILEEQFMDEDGIDFDNLTIELMDSSNSNFSRLEEAFTALSKEGIIAVHNCGYDIEEGVNDAFELLVHLKNNKFDPIGFCFYTFEDIEEAISEDKLNITFGDFNNNESEALEIGKTVKHVLGSFDFNVVWDGSVDNQIVINPFVWDKKFTPDREYEMEGAFDNFVKNNQV
ncbi:MAG: hypothetical protein Q4P18_04295 [Methanobrevibacter sp.]|uniref:DUF6891 domain-containing protein n=1 Tax=Methanobrevibacter sp. TaxID=66852 RepID=UPI0026E112A6|nr:hypothetical protein [Methanobrevibacter sp.]MDO5848732.1 hypothetical protein [Methanobrevibacter sp.]